MSVSPNTGHTASRFNISRWALEHPALTRYLMVVQAFWPGVTAQQIA